MQTIDKMIGTLHKLGDVENVSDAVKSLGKALSVIQWLFLTGQDLLDRYISDPLLKAVLAAQSGDHGLPPSQVSAFVHAGITHHYLNGGYYPKGGAYTIPRAFVRALKRAGGEIKLNASVKRIMIKDGAATGVILEDGSEITSAFVISNADPEVTFGKLIGRQYLSTKLRKKLDRVKYSVSSLSLFFAVDMDLRSAGLDSGNYWLYDHGDIDQLYRFSQSDEFLETDKFPALFLTVTTLKDPEKFKKLGVHTCEAFVFVKYDAFAKWADEQPGMRSDDYKRLKEKLADAMFKSIEKRIPGIREKVIFYNLATPLTNVHYINTTRGNIYGIEKNRKQVGPGAFSVQSEYENILLCGASTLSHGVAGVTVSGLAAAARILRCSRAELLKQNGPSLFVEPSEK